MDLNKSFKIQAYGLNIDELVRALAYQGVPNVEIDVEPDRSAFWMIIFNPSFRQLQVVDIIFDIIERDYQANISEVFAAPAPQFPSNNFMLPQIIPDYTNPTFNARRTTYDFPMPQTQNIIDYVPTYQKRPFPTNRYNAMRPIEQSYVYKSPGLPQIDGYQPYTTTPAQARQDLGLNPNSYPSPRSYQLPEYIPSPQGQAPGMSPRSNAPYSVTPSKPVLGQIMPPSNIEFFVPPV